MPKEISPFAAREFDDSVEHIVLGEDDAVMTETAVHRLLDVQQGTILLAEDCDAALHALCTNLVGEDQIEQLSVQQMTARLGLGGAGVLVANAGSLGGHPERLLASWRAADPTVVIVVTGSKPEREALLAELSGGLVHRFLITPSSSGQTRLVLASALKRHEELRRVGYTAEPPALPGLEKSGFPVMPMVATAGAVLLALGVAVWWLFRAPADPEVEVATTPAVATLPAPTPAAEPLAEQTVDVIALEAEPVASAVEESMDLDGAAQALANEELLGELGAVALFSNVLEVDPDNEAAQAGLAAAEQILLDRVALALVEGRVDDAESALADLAGASPNQPRLLALEAEIQAARSEPIQTPAEPEVEAPAVTPPPPDFRPQRALVRERISAGQFIEPADDSARFHLDALAAAGDDTAQLEQLETALHEAVLGEVSAALTALEFGQADQLLATAAVVGADSVRVAALQTELEQARERALLDRAVAALQANRLQAPAGNNAVELLAQLQAQQSDLPGLEAAVGIAARRLSLQAEAALGRQDYVAAATAIDALAGLSPESGDLATLRADLAYARRQAELFEEVIPASGLRILSYETPQYPRQAERRGIEGWVDVQFTVTAEGEPTELVVIAAEPEGVFDGSALEALASARFEPYSEDSNSFARRVSMRVRFNFAD